MQEIYRIEGRVLNLLAIVLFGCNEAVTDGPIVEAHRGAAGYYPQNSRTAMLASLEDGWDGIELDIVLTADRVPVLAHDPWVHTELCTTASGASIEERVRIDTFRLEELQEGFLCGGIADPDFPNAAVIAEPIMALDELIDELYLSQAEVVVHLDMKYEPGWTTTPDDYAAEVLWRWTAADLPQRFYISSPWPDMVEAAEDWGRRNAWEVDTSLSWPLVRRERSTIGQALGLELGATSGSEDPVAQALAVDADGMNINWELASRSLVRTARDNDLAVQLWTLNDPAVLEHHAAWPVDALITDYPGDLP